MPDLGTKYECTGCSTKFYDLGKEQPICPQCGLNQLTDEEEPVAEPEPEEPEEEESPAADKAGDEVPDEDEEGDGFDASEDE